MGDPERAATTVNGVGVGAVDADELLTELLAELDDEATTDEDAANVR
jgi:hypothetical protein